MPEEIGLHQLVKFYPRNAPSGPFPGLDYVNFEDEIRAGEVIAAESKDLSQCSALLLFGYPGNGKRAFAQRLSLRLWDEGFNVLWVDASALIVASQGEVDESIGVASVVMNSPAFRPLILAIADLDSLDASHEATKGGDAIARLLSSCARPEAGGAVLVIATAQFPKEAERILKRCAPKAIRKLYFQWPDAVRIAKFFDLLRIPAAFDVAELLYEASEENHARYTTRSLVGGAKQAARVTGLHGLAATEISKVITNFCTPTPEADVEAYMRENRLAIDAALRDFEWATDAMAPREGLTSST